VQRPRPRRGACGRCVTIVIGRGALSAGARGQLMVEERDRTLDALQQALEALRAPGRGPVAWDARESRWLHAESVPLTGDQVRARPAARASVRTSRGDFGRSQGRRCGSAGRAPRRKRADRGAAGLQEALDAWLRQLGVAEELAGPLYLYGVRALEDIKARVGPGRRLSAARRTTLVRVRGTSCDGRACGAGARCARLWSRNAEDPRDEGDAAPEVMPRRRVCGARARCAWALAVCHRAGSGESRRYPSGQGVLLAI